MILYMEEIMKRSKFTEAQIVSILKLAEPLYVRIVVTL